MGKFFMLLSGMIILFGFSYGQTYSELAGIVADEDNESLSGASVFLYPVKRGTTTDARGYFRIRNLPEGKYIVEISFIGYYKLIDTIAVAGGNCNCNRNRFIFYLL
jgi:iron complex outermembrane receptor protein